MKDLLLDKDGDLYLTQNGDVSLTDSVRQAILIRLRWFLGEWIFNTSFGMPYYSQILIKNPNTAVIEQLFRQQILSVAEVIKIESLSVQINRRLRICTVHFKALTTQGAIEEEVSIDGF
nr:MAG TPA: baseplate wedge protein [Caudoviricetes sp.]